MEIIVEKARASDLAEIKRTFYEVDALHVRLLPWHFKQVENGRDQKEILNWIKRKDCLVLVCRSNNKVIGLLTARLSNSSSVPFIRKTKMMVVETVVVAKGNRRKGIGRLLLSEAENWAIKNNVSRITLNVFIKNKGASSFYKRMDYKSISVKMEKEIKVVSRDRIKKNNITKRPPD